jgi:hypothetical protein
VKGREGMSEKKGRNEWKEGKEGIERNNGKTEKKA